MSVLLKRLLAVRPCPRHAALPNALFGAGSGCDACLKRLILRDGSDRREADRRTPNHADWLIGSVKSVQERLSARRKASRRSR